MQVLNELRACGTAEKRGGTARACLQPVLFPTARYLFCSPTSNAPSPLGLGRRSSGQGVLSLSPVGRCLV